VEKQALATLRGLDFTHFLEGDSIPPRFLPNANQEMVVNIVYLHCHKKNQLLVAWLLASMFSTILIQMVGLDSSTKIWQRLTTYYASHTRAMIKKLRPLLKTSKSERSISKYILDIKKTIDSLAVVGALIYAIGHVDTILDGLSKDYDGFITSILSRTDPYDVDELEALFLA